MKKLTIAKNDNYIESVKLGFSPLFNLPGLYYILLKGVVLRMLSVTGKVLTVLYFGCFGMVTEEKITQNSEFNKSGKL